MKGAKTTRTQHDRGRKSNKRSEKSAKLDRKSSRGMIYENEELRLRTININAEVERGQSDIKRLQRENEHLRREIWMLRDKCDHLNKRFKAKISEHEFSGCRGSGGSGGCNVRRCSGGGRGSGGCDVNSDDSDSCDTCRCDDGHCSDECCQEGGPCAPLKVSLPEIKAVNNDSECKAPPQASGQHFDHLSVVSEETLSNAELLAHQNEHLPICTPDLNSSQSTLPSLMCPLTPLTPIELVANELNDLQAMVPPLSYFENILQQHMGPKAGITPTPELGTNSSTTTGRTMRHTNGWDYNLQSPFSQRKYSANSSPARSPPLQLLPPPTLTTFVPTPTVHTTPQIALNVPPLPVTAPCNGNGTAIETVAITTNATQQTLNSPKHFFAPIKPRLKLNTKLANQGGEQDALPPGSPPPPLDSPPTIREPPDIFVNNALASPYQRQPAARPSPQVSPRHRARHQSHCQLHQPQRPCQQQSPQHGELPTAVVNVAAAVALGAAAADVGVGVGVGVDVTAGSVIDIYTAALANAAAAAAAATVVGANAKTSQAAAVFALPTLPPPTQPADSPIYATAQKRCHNTCISATALTQPVMTATTHTTKTTISPLRLLPAKRTVKTAMPQTSNAKSNATAASTVENGSQTDSANLESILNDIEIISEDILAIQLEKCRSRNNLPAIANKTSDEQNKAKPYRSEMNLYLQYDGTNPTITNGAATTATTAASNGVDANSASKLSRRTRSLEREHTDSPAPHMPDPMTPFPDKCSYLGFEQLNQAVSKATQPLQRPQGKAPPPPIGAKPSISAKPPPPLPPARTNVRGTAATAMEQPAPPPGTPPVPGLSPNHSHLYKALATAAAKRAVFRSAPTQLTHSLDVDEPPSEAQAAAGEATTNLEAAGDAGSRNARRVSIVCAEEQPAPTVPLAAPTTTASCGDLASVAAATMAHPCLKAFRQTSHSTPSSPHSSRRRTNSNTMTALPGHAELAVTCSAPPSTTHHHHNRKDAGDAPATATVSRTKCSRRHSDGTVHNAHRISNASGGGGGGGGHHHHHNHHHAHSSSLISNNPHHSHHSHQDSNHETATSLSDRNSNSFASSRESSTSFSMRSNRRKISVSSHTGGKIPWCACWGNGCL